VNLLTISDCRDARKRRLYRRPQHDSISGASGSTMATDNRQSTKDGFIGVASTASLIIANIIGVRASGFAPHRAAPRRAAPRHAAPCRLLSR
jgi:hypothetical protein